MTILLTKKPFYPDITARYDSAMFTQQANQLVVQIWSGNSIISWKNLIWDSFACLYDLGSHCERAARHTVMRNMFRAWPTTRDAATNQWHGVLILTFTASSTPPCSAFTRGRHEAYESFTDLLCVFGRSQGGGTWGNFAGKAKWKGLPL